MQTILVILIVGLAVAYVGRRFYANFKKGAQTNCSCGCGGCANENSCDDLN